MNTFIVLVITSIFQLASYPVQLMQEVTVIEQKDMATCVVEMTKLHKVAKPKLIRMYECVDLTGKQDPVSMSKSRM